MYETLHTLLNNVTASNFPLNAPQGQQEPYVVFNTRNITPTNTKSGPSTVDIIDLIIDCYAKTPLDALALANNVRAKIDYYSDETITSITFSGRTEDYGFPGDLSQVREEYTLRLKR